MTEARNQYPRWLKGRIYRDLGIYPVVAIMGARQVGKTTLAREIAVEGGLAYRSLDDADVRQLAVQDPAGLVDSVANTGAVFDEIQRAPQLLLAMKAVVDREQRNGRFLLTGSNQPRVGQHVADSLLGRVAYRTLRPLTLGEQRSDEPREAWNWFFELEGEELTGRLQQSADLSGALDWQAVTAVGGMPRALAAPPEDRLQVLDDYLQTFARRDMREVLASDAPVAIEQFMRLVATRSAMEFNAAGLANDLGQPVKAIRRWMDALERSYLVSLIPPYSRNPGARVIKRPKLVMVDPALAMAGAGDTRPTGFQFETLVANDLLVWRDAAPGRQLFYWRLPAGPEADFVITSNARAAAVETKCAATVDRADARHLSTFLDRHAEARVGILLSSDPEIRWIRERVIAAPWWAVM